MVPTQDTLGCFVYSGFSEVKLSIGHSIGETPAGVHRQDFSRAQDGRAENGRLTARHWTSSVGAGLISPKKPSLTRSPGTELCSLVRDWWLRFYGTESTRMKLPPRVKFCETLIVDSIRRENTKLRCGYSQDCSLGVCRE